MKKNHLFFILVFVCILFSGCSDPKYINLKNKPSNYYYSEKLYSSLKEDKNDFVVSVKDSNFYKKVTLKDEDKQIINNFFKTVSKKGFINKPSDLSDKPKYSIFICKSKQKYVIQVYSDSIVSIFPWDGSYPPDYICMDEIPTKYNLMNFCNYLYK